MRTKNLLSILTIVLLFSACSTRYDNPQNYFIPHESNALKLTQKHEWIVSGSVGNNTFSHENYSPITFDYSFYTVEQLSSNIQMAYSPIKHLGVFGSHSRLRNRDNNITSNIFHKSHLTTVGVGTYYNSKFLQRPLDKILSGKKEKYDGIVIDVYGGYSIGKFQNNFFTSVGNDEFNLHKLFYQAGLHWEIGAFGMSYIHKRGIGTYPSGKVNGEAPFSQNFQIQTILNDNQVSFTEHSFQIDYKKQQMGLYAQFTHSRIEEFGFFGDPDYIINLGITIDIHDVRKKLKERKKIKNDN